MFRDCNRTERKSNLNYSDFKLHSTKANDGKRTLLHFILQEIQQDHPDLLTFGDDFQVLADMASKGKKVSHKLELK